MGKETVNETENETVNEKKMDSSTKIRRYSFLMSDFESLARQLGEEDKEMKEYLLTVARDLHKEIEKLL